jgi:uncharacterized cupin superfamily protein
MRTPLYDVSTVALDDTGPLSEAVGSDMATRGKVLWANDEGVVAGVWSCTPGNSRWSFATNEFIYVVEGWMTATRDGGEAVEVRSGSTVFFEKGWQGMWLIHETILKSYVVF